MFSAIPVNTLASTTDPSHFLWQQMDISARSMSLRKNSFIPYQGREGCKDLLDDVGVLAAPLDYQLPKLPGLGDIDWGISFPL
jgi:hypothetical protein